MVEGKLQYDGGGLWLVFQLGGEEQRVSVRVGEVWHSEVNCACPPEATHPMHFHCARQWMEIRKLYLESGYCIGALCRWGYGEPGGYIFRESVEVHVKEDPQEPVTWSIPVDTQEFLRRVFPTRRKSSKSSTSGGGHSTP